MMLTFGQMMLRASTQMKKSWKQSFQDFLEVTTGFEPVDNGVADRGLTTWLRHQKYGADYGARTRHLDLGKVALYQMS